MKTTPVQIRYDANKLNALNFYLSQNGKTVEEELQKNLAELFEQEVPENVRQFIRFQSGENSGITDTEERDEAKPSRRQKNSSPKAEAATEAPTMGNAPTMTM